MKRRVMQVTRFVKRVPTNLLKLIASMFYAPKRVLNEDDSQLAEISFLRVGESSYQIAEIQKGRLFTDRLTNISIISQKSLVPYVSWQYLNGSVLPDTENFLLNRKLLVHYPPKYINDTVISLVTGGGGNYNYYHWLFDCLPRLHIAETFGKRDKYTKYFIPEDTYPFQKETLEALGIPSAFCISSKDYQHLQATNLIATSHPNPHPSAIPRWIVCFLRDSFLRLSSAKNYKRFIYISRSDSVNSRRLKNEEDLSKVLEAVGFGIYRLSELTFSDQVSLFSQAKIIVGVHGAGLANLAFASKGTVVYELFSDQYQPKMYERLSLLAGLDYHRIICKVSESTERAQQTDFRLSDDNIKTILKRVEQITTGSQLSVA